MIRAVEAGSVGEAGLTHNLYKLVRFFSGSTGPESELPYSSSESMPVSALNDCGMVPVSALPDTSSDCRARAPSGTQTPSESVGPRL